MQPVRSIRQRIRAAKIDEVTICPVPGCGRKVERTMGTGLSLTHCRYHIQFRNRHGSFWKKSYSAAELRPYREAASRCTKCPHNDGPLGVALANLQWMLDTSGPVKRVIDTFRLDPKSKARAAIARMREARVSPLKLLINCIAVTAAVHNDPIRGGGPADYYRHVQIAKACRRTASGSHAVYGPGSRHDRYPRSGGRFLPVLGKMIDEACGDGTGLILACVGRSMSEPSLRPCDSSNGLDGLSE